MASLPFWFPFALAPILAAVMLFAFRWIFSLNADVRSKPDVVIIQPLTSKHAYEFALFFFAAISIAYGCVVYSSGRTGAHWWLILGVAFAIITGTIANPHLWLDDQAMHSRLARFRTVSIPWSSLDHYAINRVVGRGGSTYFYVFRSRDGQTISVTKSTYDIDALLQKIRTHTSISEVPYKP